MFLEAYYMECNHSVHGNLRHSSSKQTVQVTLSTSRCLLSTHCVRLCNYIGDTDMHSGTVSMVSMFGTIYMLTLDFNHI
jgi:hypothetical protein